MHKQNDRIQNWINGAKNIIKLDQAVGESL